MSVVTAGIWPSRILMRAWPCACLKREAPIKSSRTIDTKDAWLAGLMDIVVQPADKFQGDPKVAV